MGFFFNLQTRLGFAQINRIIAYLLANFAKINQLILLK